MGGLLLLLALSVVMAAASFLAGILPLSMPLTQSQLRLLSSIGVGILVGTSLIVIIPEGIEAIATTGMSTHSHGTREALAMPESSPSWEAPKMARYQPGNTLGRAEKAGRAVIDSEYEDTLSGFLDDIPSREVIHVRREEKEQEPPVAPHEDKHHEEEAGLPTFFIGFSLMLGFVLMFLIDRLPRHAADELRAAPTTRHISLDNLGASSVAGEEETQGFLGSLAPTPKQSRSLATTTGLVIHAAADGIAMGASATTSNMKLGLIIFVAIMIHKAPAAFGLTAVLLKQGLSKRAARGHLIVFSLAAPVGAIATYIIVSLLGGSDMEGESGQWWTGMLLLFSAGTFLYVAMHAMQEEQGSQGHERHPSLNGYSDGSNSAAQKKESRPQVRDTVATVVGMLLPLLTQFGHHH